MIPSCVSVRIDWVQPSPPKLSYLGAVQFVAIGVLGSEEQQIFATVTGLGGRLHHRDHVRVRHLPRLHRRSQYLPAAMEQPRLS